VKPSGDDFDLEQRKATEMTAVLNADNAALANSAAVAPQAADPRDENKSP